jgi:hypothetical protein
MGVACQLPVRRQPKSASSSSSSSRNSSAPGRQQHAAPVPQRRVQLRGLLDAATAAALRQQGHLPLPQRDGRDAGQRCNRWRCVQEPQVGDEHLAAEPQAACSVCDPARRRPARNERSERAALRAAPLPLAVPAGVSGVCVCVCGGVCSVACVSAAHHTVARLHAPRDTAAWGLPLPVGRGARVTPPLRCMCSGVWMRLSCCMHCAHTPQSCVACLAPTHPNVHSPDQPKHHRANRSEEDEARRHGARRCSQRHVDCVCVICRRGCVRKAP